MPDLPAPIAPQIVGFPTPETIVVTKTDMIAIVVYVQAMRDYITAAAACLAVRS